MMFDENNVNVLIIKVPKWTSICIWQTMETMIEFKLLIRMSELNGKNKWVNLRKVMTSIWPKEWYHNVIYFDG